jgi:hypothetical protein
MSAAFSKKFAHDDIQPQDLLDALAHLHGISDVVLSDQGYARKALPKPLLDADRVLESSAHLRTIVTESHEQAHQLGHHYVGTEHLLLALMKTNPELMPDAKAVCASVLDVLGLSEIQS